MPSFLGVKSIAPWSKRLRSLEHTSSLLGVNDIVPWSNTLRSKGQTSPSLRDFMFFYESIDGFPLTKSRTTVETAVRHFGSVWADTICPGQSLNDNLLSVHDIQSLDGLRYTLTGEVVNGNRSVVASNIRAFAGFDALDASRSSLS